MIVGSTDDGRTSGVGMIMGSTADGRTAMGDDGVSVMPAFSVPSFHESPRSSFGRRLAALRRIVEPKGPSSGDEKPMGGVGNGWSCASGDQAGEDDDSASQSSLKMPAPSHDAWLDSETSDVGDSMRIGAWLSGSGSGRRDAPDPTTVSSLPSPSESDAETTEEARRR
eukprot:338046-Rhodomonas_salina.2